MDNNQDITPGTGRPFFLSILCIAILSYSLLFILLFLAAIIYSNWITGLLSDFLATGQVRRDSVLIISSAGILLYGISFTGAFYMWKQKRKGLYFYIISSVLIISLPYIFGFGNIVSTIVLLILILLILAYYRKLH